jgi:hypothetical protein
MGARSSKPRGDEPGASPTARIIHLLATADCEYTARHTGVSEGSWIKWWEAQKGGRPRYCCTYLMNDSTGTYDRCTSPPTEGAHVKHEGSAWILPTCHGCNMQGKTLRPAAWTHKQWLQRLVCDCPYQEGAQMRMHSRVAQSRHAGGGGSR